MPEPLDWQLIDRYLAGEASPDEVADVRSRATADPVWAQALELLRSNFAKRTPRQWNADLAWSRVRPRLTTEEIPTVRSQPARTHAPLRDTTTRWRIAASVLVVTGSIVTWQAISRVRPHAPNATTPTV